MEENMEELMQILEDIRPDVEFDREERLIDDKILSSFDILSIIAEISDSFGIKLSPAQIRPENFNSAKAIWEMITKLQSVKKA